MAGKPGHSAAATPALGFLTERGIPHGVHTFDHDHSSRGDHPDFAMEAARLLGVPPEAVFKSLVWFVDSRLVLALVPATTTVSAKFLARAVGGKKANLADVASAERVSGSVTGAISPLGLRQELPVVIDEEVRLHPVVYVSAGRRGLEVSLDPQDLIAATSARVAALSTPTRN
ncbi:MAG: aminoacyl-tRNA deacylase [Candidatus Nanopelagicales bacterium]